MGRPDIGISGCAIIIGIICKDKHIAISSCVRYDHYDVDEQYFAFKSQEEMPAYVVGKVNKFNKPMVLDLVEQYGQIHNSDNTSLYSIFYNSIN